MNKCVLSPRRKIPDQKWADDLKQKHMCKHFSYDPHHQYHHYYSVTCPTFSPFKFPEIWIWFVSFSSGPLSYSGTLNYTFN